MKFDIRNVISRSLLILSFALISIDLSAQGLAPLRSTLSGYLRDKSSGEMMGNVVVLAQKSGVRTTTNNYGFFSITLNLNCFFV